MKKYLLLLIVLLPISLFAQQSARVANLIESYSGKKGVTYVEMGKPMLNAILCRQQNSTTLTATEKAKLAPCSVPDVFKSLSLQADAECMKAFKEAATKDKFIVLKKNSGAMEEANYYTKEYGDKQSEILILMYTEYCIDRPTNGNLIADPDSAYPVKMSIVYMAGAIDVSKTEVYLSGIFKGLRVEAHITDYRRVVQFAKDIEKPISIDGLSIDELNKLVENYQRAIEVVKRANTDYDKALMSPRVTRLQKEISRFQAKLLELKGGRISTSSYSLYRAPSTSTTTITPNSDQP